MGCPAAWVGGHGRLSPAGPKLEAGQKLGNTGYSGPVVTGVIGWLLGSVTRDTGLPFHKSDLLITERVGGGPPGPAAAGSGQSSVFTYGHCHFEYP